MKRRTIEQTGFGPFEAGRQTGKSVPAASRHADEASGTADDGCHGRHRRVPRHCFVDACL